MTRCAFLFAFLCFHEVGAQFSIYANGVVGTYGMGSMKNFQNAMVSEFAEAGIDAKPVLVFPPSVQVEGGFNWLPDPYEPAIGAFVNYASTQGKVLYRDYSGQVYSELNLTRWVFGGKATRTFVNGFGIYGKVGFNKTSIDLVFATQLNDFDPDVVITKYYSGGFCAEPGISWTYTIGRLGLSAQAGFEMNVQGKSRSEDDRSAYLVTLSGQQILANWSGVRAGLGLSLRLSGTD